MSKLTNRDRIEKEALKHDLVIGCFDDMLESLSQKELKKVLENLQYQDDTDVKIGRRDYVVEIDIVDNEVDFSVLTKREYIDRYGDERYEDD